MTMTLKQMRRKAGLRAEEVAAYIGVSYTTIRNWEQGRTIPTLNIFQIEKLLDIYSTSLDEFVATVKASQKDAMPLVTSEGGIAS
jgi:transcriptional regulator with XRE-family HTH domain